MADSPEQFIDAMARFLEWTLFALGDDFRRQYLPPDLTPSQMAYELLSDAVNPVRGNLSEDARFDPEDYGRIMDAVVVAHCELRPPEIRVAIANELLASAADQEH